MKQKGAEKVCHRRDNWVSCSGKGVNINEGGIGSCKCCGREGGKRGRDVVYLGIRVAVVRPQLMPVTRDSAIQLQYSYSI